VFSLSISLVQVIAFSFATNFDELWLWGHLKGRIWALKSKWSHVFSSHMTVLSLFKDKFYFDLCLTY
jgi:hypothetical protein